MTPLTRDGFNFVTPDRQIVKWRGVTAFTALGDWLGGRRDKLERYADAVQPYGVNFWRVFAMWVNTGLTPRQPGYYSGALEFFEWAKARGLYIQGTAFCDQVSGSSVLLTRTQQDAHLRAWVDIARGAGNVVVEISNEDWKNGDIAGNYAASDFTGVLATRSAAPDDQYPDVFGPFLDFTVHHPPRAWDWMRRGKELIDTCKLGVGGHPDPANPFHRWMDPTGLPALDTERTRIAEGTTPQQHADAAALAELFGGGNIHGGFRSFDPSHETDLQNCVFTDACVPFFEAVSQVWLNGMPADTCSAGSYLRGTADNTGDLGIDHWDRYTDAGENPAGALRTFAMQVGARQVIVPIDRGPQWQLGLRNGYRLVESRGFNGNIIIVER